MSLGHSSRESGDGSNGAGDASPNAERARAVGESTATALCEAHGTDDVSTLRNAVGVTVRRSEWDGIDGVHLFGTYADGVITLYESQLPHLAERLDVSLSVATTLVLAHELGHHVLDGCETATSAHSGWRRRLASWVGESEQRAFEEQAAHWFALALVDENLSEDVRAELCAVRERETSDGTDTHEDSTDRDADTRQTKHKRHTEH